MYILSFILFLMFIQLLIIDVIHRQQQLTVCLTNHHITLNHIHPNLTLPCKLQAWGMGFSEKSYAMLLSHLGCLYL
jgi:hypothetical protein